MPKFVVKILKGENEKHQFVTNAKDEIQALFIAVDEFKKDHGDDFQVETIQFSK